MNALEQQKKEAKKKLDDTITQVKNDLQLKIKVCVFGVCACERISVYACEERK